MNGGGLCRLQCFIVGSVAEKLTGFGVVAGNCKLRDKKRCLLVDLLGVAAGDGGKSAVDFALDCCHGENLLVLCFGGWLILYRTGQT